MGKGDMSIDFDNPGNCSSKLGTCYQAKGERCIVGTDCKILVEVEIFAMKSTN